MSSYALIELDLLMKSRGFTLEERYKVWTVFENVISDKIAFSSSTDFKIASWLQGQGYDYFDSLIAAQAVRLNLKPLTTDSKLLEAFKKAKNYFMP